MSANTSWLFCFCLPGLVLFAAALGGGCGAFESNGGEYYRNLLRADYQELGGPQGGEWAPAAVMLPEGQIPLCVSLGNTRAEHFRVLDAVAGVFASARGIPPEGRAGVTLTRRGPDLALHVAVDYDSRLLAGLGESLFTSLGLMKCAGVTDAQRLLLPEALTLTLDGEAGEDDSTGAGYREFDLEEGKAFRDDGGRYRVYFLLPLDGRIFLGAEGLRGEPDGGPKRQAALLLEQLSALPRTREDIAGGGMWAVPPGGGIEKIEFSGGALTLTTAMPWFFEESPWVRAAVDCLRLTLGQIREVEEINLVSKTLFGRLRTLSVAPATPLREAGGVLLNPIAGRAPSEGAPRTVLLGAVGDVLLDRGVARMMEERGSFYPFRRVADQFHAHDLTLMNLECPLAASGSPLLGKGIWFRGDPGSCADLRRAGVDVINLANNHILDYGREALLETLGHLRRWGFLPSGVGRDEVEARRPVFWEGRGLSIGVLGYTDFADLFWDWNHPETFRAGDDLAGVAPLEPDLMVADVRRAKPACDALVVSVHWGVEYRTQPTGKQVELARRLINEGASAVIGHHSHVLQGVEEFRGAPILYSLGNFVFDQRPPARRQTVTASLWWRGSPGGPGQFERVIFTPYLIEDCRPARARGGEAEAILRGLKRASSERGSQFEQTDHRLILDLTDAGE